MLNFSELIAPLSLAEFCRNVLGKSHQLLEPGRAVTDRLLSWELLQQALEISSFDSDRSILLTKMGENAFTRPIYRDHVSKETGLVDTAGIYKEVRDGATLVFNSIQRHIPALNRLGADMKRHFGESPSFNCYGSIKPQPGLGLHWDDHDVIAIQTEGRKFWQLYERVPNSFVKHQSGEQRPDGKTPTWEGYLEAGQCLYVPRGTWHSVLSTGAPSLHITCGFFGITLHRILRSLMQNEANIAGFSNAVSPEYMTDAEILQFENDARSKVQQIMSGGFLKQYWADEKANMHPVFARSAFDAPRPNSDTSLAQEDALVLSRIARNPEIASDSRGISFMVNKTEYYLPMEMQPIFKMLTDSDAVEMRSLYTAAARGGIDVSRVDSMLRTLFGHGIIEFVACEKL
jgi:hypothetical protein